MINKLTVPYLFLAISVLSWSASAAPRCASIFNSLESSGYVTEQVEKTYRDSWNELSAGKIDAANVMLKSLGVRVANGTFHGPILLEWGFELRKLKRQSQQIVLPPRNISTFVRKYQTEMRAAVARNEITEADIIAPGIVVQNALGELDIIPINAIPKDGWSLSLDAKELPLDKYFSALAGGLFPINLEFKYFVDHELTHLLDFASSKLGRQYMAALKKAAKKYTRYPSMLYRPGVGLRNLFMGEYISLPNIEKRKDIEFLTKDISQDMLSDIQLHKEYLRSLTKEDLEKRIKHLLEVGPSLLIQIGGGINDSFNLEFKAGTYKIISYFHDLVFKSPGVRNNQISNIGGPDILLQTPTGLLRQLYVVAKLLNLKTSGNYFSNDLDSVQELQGRPPSGGMDSDLLRAPESLMEILIDRIAWFERNLIMGVRLGISPARLVEESAMSKVDPNSLTGTYIKNAYPPQSPVARIYYSKP